MEGRETDHRIQLIDGACGLALANIYWIGILHFYGQNDFLLRYDRFPKEEYETFFTINPICILKVMMEAWNILSKNVYETIANKASGYETVIRMPTRKGKKMD